MEIAKIEVSGVQITVTEKKKIPAGIIGATVGITYTDPMWDGLEKTVVFRGEVTKDVLKTGEKVVIPHEAVERPGYHLYIGVYGSDGVGNIAIPTLWADLGHIYEATDPSNDVSANPQLQPWDEVRKELPKLAADAANAVLEEAKETGVFDGVDVTHEWNGTVLTVTSASGTSSADLKGEKGDTGSVDMDTVLAVPTNRSYDTTIFQGNALRRSFHVGGKFGLGDYDGYRINKLAVKAEPGTNVRFALYEAQRQDETSGVLTRLAVLGDAVADSETGMAQLEFVDGYCVWQDNTVILAMAQEAVIRCQQLGGGLTVEGLIQFDDGDYFAGEPGTQIPFFDGTVDSDEAIFAAVFVLDFDFLTGKTLGHHLDEFNSKLNAFGEQIEGFDGRIGGFEERLAAMEGKVHMLPEVTAEDDGKLLAAKDGALTLVDPEGVGGDDAELLARMEELENQIADMKYVAIDITSVSNNVGTAELGSTVEEVTVSWKVNKAPTAQTVNGEPVAATARSETLSGLSITGNKTFTVAATDERGATDSGTTTVNFCNGVYYGTLEDGAEVDSAAILTLNRKLQNSRTVTFTATANAGQRLAYAIPNRSPYGTPAFKDVNTGFQAGFYLAATIPFTNGSGYTEDYNVWLSTHPGIGTITVAVT